MRARNDREHNQEASTKGREPQRADNQQTQVRERVPKIQYRFLMDLQERGVSKQARQDAEDIVSKIRRFPLEPAHVMTAWERTTKAAIADYKEGRGSQELRTRHHQAQAILFSVVRDGPPVKDADELRSRIAALATKQTTQAAPVRTILRPPASDPQTQAAAKAAPERAAAGEERVPVIAQAAPVQQELKDAAIRASEANGPSGASGSSGSSGMRTTTQVAPDKPTRVKRQRTKVKDESTPAEPERAKRPAEKDGRARDSEQEQEQQQQKKQQPPPDERTKADQKLETLMTRLKELPEKMRTMIDESARALLLEGNYTRETARLALPAAMAELQHKKGPENVVRALTLATIARTKDHDALLMEVGTCRPEEQREISHAARSRLEMYPPQESGLFAVRHDQLAAAVRMVTDPSDKNRREALILTLTREEVETFTDPQRTPWDQMAEQLASDIA